MNFCLFLINSSHLILSFVETHFNGHSLAEVSAFEGLPTLHSEVNNTPLNEPASELNGGSGDKPKRKRKPKKKTHLDESFPSYLRVS